MTLLENSAHQSVYLIEKLQGSNATIFPFVELISTWGNEKNAAEADKNSIQATELFSMFTADIIKQEVVFTR